MSEKLSIAVVDDDVSVREALAGLIKALGYRALAFPSGGDFLASSEGTTADCLIADVRMPEMTGPELQEHLRRCGNAIPTILITAHPDEATRARVFRGGAKGFLVKPFSEDALIEALGSALGAQPCDGTPDEERSSS